MESPVKKLAFSVADKENQPLGATTEILEKPETPVVHEVKKVEEKTAVAAPGKPGKPDESDEPLLMENSQRFVLFPIKYHEVCDAPKRVK